MPTYTNKGKYLLVEAGENYSLNLFMKIIRETAERCDQEGLKKVLVDITKMSGSPSIIDRYETGVEIAKCLGGGLQVAALVKKGLINFLAETVAVNRGATFKVFSEIKPALEWLEAGKPASD